MKIETFEEQIRKRANETVQKKIADCKHEVYGAIGRLLSKGGPSAGSVIDHNYAAQSWNSDVKRILEVLASGENHKGWPSSIWEVERTRLTTEILARMDELQRTLLAKDLEPDDVSGEPS